MPLIGMQSLSHDRAKLHRGPFLYCLLDQSQESGVASPEPTRGPFFAGEGLQTNGGF